MNAATTGAPQFDLQALWDEVGIRLIAVADIKPETNRWLWKGRIPLGMITLLEGDPDQGKSFITIDLAARVTTATTMPGEQRSASPAAVVFLSTEDHFASTIRPRCEAAEADMRRVLLVDTMKTDDGAESSVMLSRGGLARLEKAITWCKARVVVIDPLMAYLPDGVDSYKDQDVRLVLSELAAIARRTGAAILIVRHLNKGGGKDIHRGGGSIGIAGAARSILKVEKVAGSKVRRVLKSIKSNLATSPPPLHYQVADADGYRLVDADGNEECVGKVEWELSEAWAPSEGSKGDVLDVARSRPDGFKNVTELARAAGGGKQSTLGLIRGVLADGRLVKRNGRIHAGSVLSSAAISSRRNQ